MDGSRRVAEIAEVVRVRRRDRGADDRDRGAEAERRSGAAARARRARGRARRARRPRGRARIARPLPPGSAARSSRCAEPAARATRPRRRSAAAWRSLGAAGGAGASGCALRAASRSPLPLAVAGRGRRGMVGARRGAPATGGRSSGRCRRSPWRSPTRWPPGAPCGRSLGGAPLPPSTGPPAVELTRLGAELDLGARPRRRSRRCDGACARRASTPSPPRCSASGSPAATSPGSCAASPTAPPSAIGPPRTPARRRRRPASRACSSSRCRPAPPSSRSWCSRGFFARHARLARRRRRCSPLAAALQLAGFLAIRRLSRRWTQ